MSAIPRQPNHKPRLSHGPCRACAADMWWAVTENGAKLPLDPDVDHEYGNFVLRGSDNRAIKFRSTAEAEDWLFAHEGDGPYTAHFATCPARQKDQDEVLQERLL